MQKTGFMRVILLSLICLMYGLYMPLHAAAEHEPSGLPVVSNVEVQPLDDVTVAAELFTPEATAADPALNIPVQQFAEKDTTKKEDEPRPEPLVLAGAGAVAAGTGLAVAGAFGAPILLLIAAICLAGGALLTAMGWKKIKAEPKKYSGEKIAVINYMVIGIIGVLASFYSLYILFTV